jgi:putative oxidoreductase
MKKWLTHRSPLFDDIAKLAIRVPAGIFLAMHGLAKLRGGVDGFANGLAERGFPLPSLFAWAATLSELVGGALVAIGLLCRPAAAFAGITMVVAVLSTHAHQIKQVGSGQGVGFEYPVLLGAVFFGLMLAGPGRFSFDQRGR